MVHDLEETVVEAAFADLVDELGFSRGVVAVEGREIEDGWSKGLGHFVVVIQL